MANLYLVKGSKKKEQDAPKPGKGSSAFAPSGLRRDKSTERRYRYPSEEIWQVSEERWQVETDADLTPGSPSRLRDGVAWSAPR